MYIFITVPLPTYILGPVATNQMDFYGASDDGSELCPNLTYLGMTMIHTLKTEISNKTERERCKGHLEYLITIDMSTH